MKSERSYPIYKVNKKAEASLVGGHPWVYENDILEFPETEPENGTLADVVSPKGAYLGTGFVSLKSKIRVRLISRNANDTFDASFWRRRVEYAWAYRKTVLEPADLSACRVIFGEADQFPGLTVDRFNNILVTQTLSVGMEKLKPLLFPLLAEVLRADGQTIDGIYERNDEALRAKEGLEQSKGWFELPGESHPASTQTEICENGVYYHVDFENGQKTGFFLDQKYNRRAVARLAAGHTVLDCFTHTGSFALNAASGGAARVTAADISADAIAMAQRNAERNGLTNMDFLCRRPGCRASAPRTASTITSISTQPASSSIRNRRAVARLAAGHTVLDCFTHTGDFALNDQRWRVVHGHQRRRHRHGPAERGATA